MRLLFVTWDGGGNVPPALGIARELQQRGHDVRVMGHPVQRAAVEAAGLAFRPYQRARAFRGVDKHSLPAYVATFGDRGMGHDVVEELRSQEADVVVVDCMMFGPLEALQSIGQRYVLLEHLFDEYFTRKWLRGPIGLGLAMRRFKAQRLLDGAQLRLVASLAELDPASQRAASPANLHYTGPIVSGAPAALTSDAVLVSLSTFNFPGLTSALQRIVEALGTLDVKGIVTTGPVVDPSELRAPGNVTVHRYLPHTEVLPEVSLVIGHGGHATTMAALAHDVPLLVLPMHPLLDQPMVGRAVANASAGSMLSKRAKPATIAEAAGRLLSDGSHRRAAAELGAAIRAADGAKTAASHLEAVLS
jgi:UDP:flavonoid glycosyltransferase YjiC (YdhE family)